MNELNKKTVFVFGGARSGKSSFVLSEAEKHKGKKAFIATATPGDTEMAERIEKHRQERGAVWKTIEEPLKLEHTLLVISGEYDVIIIDCLTLWLSNLLCSGEDVKGRIASFVESLSEVNCRLYMVANEVGLGIVPENQLARSFRDLAGLLNRQAAECSDDVYLMAAGIPLKIK